MKSIAKSLWCGLVSIALCSQSMSQNAVSGDEIEKLRQAVEASPNDIKAHQAFIKAMKFDSPELVRQYDEWIKKNPTAAIYPYAIGNALSNRENPRARPYLQKAIQLDPNYDEAYYSLAGDAERWGEFDVSFASLKKAMELEPNNADYAFRYINSDQIRMDKSKYKELTLKFVQQFPSTMRGAQALYWLAHRMDDPQEKRLVYEQQKKDFPAKKFDWTLYGMDDYFNLLLPEQPQKALVLAEEISKVVPQDDSYAKKGWEANLAMVKSVLQIDALLAKSKKAEAVAVLKKITPPRRGNLRAFFTIYQSKVLDATGNSAVAYKNLLLAYAAEPSDDRYPLLLGYGKKLGKDAQKVESEIWHVRDSASKVAPDFNLENYFTKSNTALSDFKGKVVLLTYWFPGCGPCRGEFPHFENVVRKFKDRKDFVYVGINLFEDQDEYVIPFVKSSGYSFIPLKDNDKWRKGPLDNQGLAPMNFMIDGNGRIMFKDFRTDLHNEKTLETMISSLLDRKQASGLRSAAVVQQANITGTIHLVRPVDKLYIGYMVNDTWVKDSAVIQNNKFAFKANIDEPFEANLYVNYPKKNGTGSDYQMAKFFMEPGNIQLNIGDSLHKLTVTGSKSQVEYEKVQAQAKKFEIRMHQLRATLAKDRSTMGEQAAEEKYRKAIDELFTERKEKVYGPYLRSNPGSPIALEVLQNYIGSWLNVELQTLLEAEQLYATLPASTRETSTGKVLARRMDAAKKVSIGAMAVDFTLLDSLNNPISLSSLRGKYVLIDFWASWCVPCRANNPHLVKAYHHFRDKNFTIIGVAFDGGERLEKAWRKAMVTDGLPWVNVNDITYPAVGSVGKQYNVGSIPQNVLVDPSGKIIARNIEGPDLERELVRILAVNK